jgi:nicotinamide-nucleotide amidase
MNNLLPKKIAGLAADVVSKNKAAGRTISCAESCTGGLVSGAITEILIRRRSKCLA